MFALREGQSLQPNVRLNVFVSDYSPDSKITPEKHGLQMQNLCSLVASSFNEVPAGLLT